MSETLNRGKRGIVHLVGAGPGDPGLLTVRGRELLEAADTVAYDHLVSLAVMDFTHPGAERIFVGKEAGRHTVSQGDLNALLVERARRGECVVRLKGGDPFIFGRGGEEAQALAGAGVPFTIVPGITSAVAAPAYAGIPVTHRALASTVAFVTGHEDPAKADSSVDWDALAQMGTIVVLMGVGRLEAVAERLMTAGLSSETPAALIHWGTTTQQRTLVAPLGSVSDRASAGGFRSPAVFVVGEVVRLRDELNWLETRPLFGRTILVTRARHQASALSAHLEVLGARVIECPTIELVPVAEAATLEATFEELSSYSWVIFTSANAVSFFLESLWESGRDVRAFGEARLCVIGPATRNALERWRLRVALQPETYVAESLVEALHARGDLRGERVLLPRAKGARDVLPEELRAMGAEVTELALYRAVPPARLADEALGALRRGEVDFVTFTSSSTVRHFCDMVGEEAPELLRGTCAAAIGPVTRAAAKARGLAVDVTATKSTIEGLTEAILRTLATSPRSLEEPAEIMA